MELISTYGPRPALGMAGKRAGVSHRPMRLRYALAAIVLSVMGVHLAADFEEPPTPAKSTTPV
jgi:hypothetical protein